MDSRLFKYDEPRYYWFGLRMGLANLLHNGFPLGAKRTIGLVIQPINSFWRFPEYYFFAEGIEGALREDGAPPRPRILDVSSPKCFGLYLACNFGVDVHLTDIDGPTVKEARLLWKTVKRRAKGRVEFSLQDARSLGYPDGSFDVVYSMSVIEHVGGNEGDSDALREMARVLKPGGLLAVSVPFGPSFVEQDIVGLRGAAQKTPGRARYFFQRIYSPEAVRERILSASPSLAPIRAISIGRRGWIFRRLHGRLGPLPAILGPLYPVASSLTNTNHAGMFPQSGRYGRLNNQSDIYGDLILELAKAPRAQATRRQSRSVL